MNKQRNKPGNIIMKYNKFFTMKRREEDCKDITVLKDKVPIELQNLIYDIHRVLDSSFPDDWTYSIISDAFEDIEENFEIDVDIETITSNKGCDIYNTTLLEWAKPTYAQCLIDEAIEDFGLTGFIPAITNGQYLGINKIYSLVNDFIKEEQEEG